MGEDFVRIFASNSWLQSEILKGRLEAEGVPVQLSGSTKGCMQPGPGWKALPAIRGGASHSAQ
jgi:hypothetical protein